MEFKYQSEYNNQLFFLYGDKKYVGKPLESSIVSDFRSSGKYHLNETIVQGELPSTLTGVLIEYLFKEKVYHMKWICYFDSLPSESDREIMSLVFGYVLADTLNISNPEIVFTTDEQYRHEAISLPIANLQDWVFLNPAMFKP